MTTPSTPAADVELRSAIHVDTSLHIEQQKHPQQAAPVRIALAQYRYRSTASYAKLEFKRAWLKDLALIYAKAEGRPDIGAVITAIGTSNYHPARQRHLHRALQAISAFLSRSPQPTNPRAHVNRLRSHLLNAIQGAYTQWEQGPNSYTHEYDGTACVRAQERPSVASNGALDVTVPRCKRESISCSIDAFFIQHAGRFDQIAKAVEAAGDVASEELRKTAETIRVAQDDPGHLCNDKHCARISDSIIAVEGVQVGRFAANNDKEWVTISNALGCELENPVRGAKAAAAAASAAGPEPADPPPAIAP